MKKGEIWDVDLSVGTGHEQSGHRPAIVVASANGLVLVIPLTRTDSRATFSHTQVIEPSPENGLTEVSVALIFQLKSIDRARLRRKRGELTRDQVVAIDSLLCDLLGLL